MTPKAPSSLGLFLGLLVAAGGASESVEDLAAEFGPVVFASVVFLHGERAPLRSYPNDPHKNYSEWNNSWGQLTSRVFQRGLDHHRRLGLYLRARYVGLLGDEHCSRQVRALSSDVDRTLVGAQVTASALCGGYVPVHASLQEDDDPLAPVPSCARYFSELERVQSSAPIRCLNRRHRKIFSYVARSAGLSKFHLSVYDTLKIQEMHNLTLPEWTKAVYPDELKPIVIFALYILTGITKDLQKYSVGALLDDVCQAMEAKTKGELVPDRNLQLYSVHDVTIANLMQALGIMEAEEPPPCAAIMVELRMRTARSHYVTVWYKRSPQDEERQMTVAGCGRGCPLDDFLSLVEDVRLRRHDEECSSRADPGAALAFNIPRDGILKEWQECFQPA